MEEKENGLRTIRRHTGLKAIQVAQRAGVTSGTISKAERRGIVSEDLSVRLSKVFDLPVAWIIQINEGNEAILKQALDLITERQRKTA